MRAKIATTIIAAVTAIVLLASCGGQPTQSSGPPATSAPTKPPATAAPSTPSGLASHAESFNTTLADGSRFHGTIGFGPILSANSDEAAQITAAFPQGLPFAVDQTRDGLIYGTLSLHNETPQFTSQHFGVGFSLGQRPDPVDVGVGYTNGSQGTDNNERLLNIIPDFSSPDWGPVPLVVVIRNLYTPAHPKGDPDVLANDAFNFIMPGTVHSSGPLLHFETQVVGGVDGATALIDPVRWGRSAM